MEPRVAGDLAAHLPGAAHGSPPVAAVLAVHAHRLRHRQPSDAPVGEHLVLPLARLVLTAYMRRKLWAPLNRRRLRWFLRLHLRRLWRWTMQPLDLLLHRLPLPPLCLG